MEKIATTYSGMIPLERFLLETCQLAGYHLQTGSLDHTSPSVCPAIVSMDEPSDEDLQRNAHPSDELS
jgi:hypothetical protein